jgi:hypothetical protein
MSLDSAPLKYLGLPVAVGAYIVTNKREMHPVIMSYSNTQFFTGGTGTVAVALVYVIPGYKLEMYQGNNYPTNGLIGTIDNTLGSKAKLASTFGVDWVFDANDVPEPVSAVADIQFSCKLFYKGNELFGNLSSTSAYAFLTPVHGSGVPSPPSNAVSLPYTSQYSPAPSFAPVYLTGPKGSYPIFTSIDSFRLYHMGEMDVANEYYLIAPNFTLITYMWGNDTTASGWWNVSSYSYTTSTATKYENNTGEWQIFKNDTTAITGYDPWPYPQYPNACRLYFHGTEIAENLDVNPTKTEVCVIS